MIAAVEDPLSEAVVRRMVEVVRADLDIWQVMGLTGNGYLRTKCRELNRTAAHVPVFLLTDQDRPNQCPPNLIRAWLPIPRNVRLFFRVAVMEVESWVMAHRERFAECLRIPAGQVPDNTDAIADPKAFILDLARGSRSREVKADIVPSPGSTARVGPGYNLRLGEFASTVWDPTLASRHSPSLARTLLRLQALPGVAPNA